MQGIKQTTPEVASCDAYRCEKKGDFKIGAGRSLNVVEGIDQSLGDHGDGETRKGVKDRLD
jgi:hypothetical protein